MDNDFLTIKLSHLGDIPKVYYKGEEITQKVKVSFIWNSKTEKEYGGCNIRLEHFEKLETERIGKRIINHRTGSFLMGDDDNSKSN